MKIILTAEMRMRLAYAEELDITDIVAPIIAERNALAAQVEVLGDKLSEVVALLDVDGMTAMQWLLDNCPEIESLTDIEPEQHLRELRAEAGRAGWVACVDWLVENSSANLFTDGEAEQARDIGDQYADSIRNAKGGEE